MTEKRVRKSAAVTPTRFVGGPLDGEVIKTRLDVSVFHHYKRYGSEIREGKVTFYLYERLDGADEMHYVGAVYGWDGAGQVRRKKP